MPEEGQAEEAIEADQAGESPIGERAVKEQAVGSGSERHQIEARFAAMPGLEDRELMEEGQPGIGDTAAVGELTQMRLASQGADGAVPGVCT